MRLMQTKSGDYVLEIEGRNETVTDYTGTTTFVYLTEKEMEKLSFELWAEAMDRGLRKIAQ